MDENPLDPKENPVGTGHLPVAGEVGVGPVSRSDPLTHDTDDDPDSAIDVPLADADEQ